jgi:hypothetical protein
MTAAARITQADMDRAVKSVRAGGYERARIVMNLAKGEIEVIIGDSGGTVPLPTANEWDRE